MEQEINFDFNEILNQFRSGKRLTGKDGLLAPLIKQLTEAALEAEVESHIANDALNGRVNRRNGFNSKTIKGTSDGSFELETPSVKCNPKMYHLLTPIETVKYSVSS